MSRSGGHAATIRRARARDAPLLPPVERSSGQAFRSIESLAWIADDDVMSEQTHLDMIAGGWVFVAAVKASLISGFLSGAVAGGALHVAQLSVAAEFQRQGIGRRLMAHTVEQARGAGVRAVTLTTFRDVAWNEPFYRSLGFRSLSATQLPSHLRDALAREAAAGLPMEQRCAMRLDLSRA